MTEGSLAKKFHFIQKIKDFFLQNGFVEVLVPPLVENPGMETHIHPFQVASVYKKETLPLYLQTSPEFKIKQLLSLFETEKLDKVFNISYCFRDEPKSEIHRLQFLMLEWYRLFESYEKIEEDTKKLVNSLTGTSQKYVTKTIQELINEITNIDILEFLEFNELKNLLLKDFSELPSKNLKNWDDCFWTFFLNKIEPYLKEYPYLFLKEFPAPLAALSKLKKSDERVCERFEFYLNGVEIANCFHELTDLNEQKKRFELQNSEKKSTYGYQLPKPSEFYESLERGLPHSSGIALGVERLIKEIIKVDNPFWD